MPGVSNFQFEAILCTSATLAPQTHLQVSAITQWGESDAGTCQSRQWASHGSVCRCLQALGHMWWGSLPGGTNQSGRAARCLSA